MKIKNKKVVISSLAVGDKVWICSTDCGVMKANKESEITMDAERIKLLKCHSKLNYVFASQADMVEFINESNLTKS